MDNLIEERELDGGVVGRGESRGGKRLRGRRGGGGAGAAAVDRGEHTTIVNNDRWDIEVPVCLILLILPLPSPIYLLISIYK